MEKNLMKSQIWKEKFWLCEVGFVFFFFFFLAPVKRVSLLGPRVFAQLSPCNAAAACSRLWREMCSEGRETDGITETRCPGGEELRCCEESTGCELEARVSSFCLKEIFY